MKTLRIISALLTLLLVPSVSAQEKSASEALKYTAGLMTGGMNYLIIQHEVEDLVKWEKAYESDMERRNQAGLKEMMVLNDVENPHSITVIFEFSDINAVNEMLADPELAEKMKSAGVITKPVFTSFRVLNSKEPVGRSYILVKHKVENYDTWKNAFDEHEIARNEYNVSFVAVGRELADSQAVVTLLCSDKTGNIISFLEGSNVKTAMKEAGVISDPTINITTQKK